MACEDDATVSALVPGAVSLIDSVSNPVPGTTGAWIISGPEV
jgi:hypothetical protein